jgi:hypothetical protein
VYNVAFNNAKHRRYHMGSKYLSLITGALKKSPLHTEVEIQGVKFTLTPSSTKDEYVLAGYMASIADNQEDMFTSLQSIRARTLASMILSINGEEIPEMVEKEDGSKVERVIYLAEDISTWPSVLVNTLYTVATDFKKKVRTTMHSSVKYEWFGANLLEKEDKEEREAEAMDSAAKVPGGELKEVTDSASPAEKSSFQQPSDV